MLLKSPGGDSSSKNVTSPSARFITWLAIQNRLATKNRASKWTVIEDTYFVMWNSDIETTHHLLHDCQYAQEIRGRLFSFLQHRLENTNIYTGRDFDDE